MRLAFFVGVQGGSALTWVATKPSGLPGRLGLPQGPEGPSACTRSDTFRLQAARKLQELLPVYLLSTPRSNAVAH